MTEKDVIKILFIEDDEGDARLIFELFKSAPDRFRFDITHKDYLKKGIDYLQSNNVDIILLDLSLPDGFGIETYIKISHHAKSIPVIVLSGNVDEDTAIKTVESGAQDYLVKGSVTPELLFKSIQYSIVRQKLVNQLNEVLVEIETLSGLLPICYSCKKIRDDKQIWIQMEEYISSRSKAQFTHGLCPDCATNFKKEIEDYYKKT